jgi:hypothetical protein
VRAKRKTEVYSIFGRTLALGQTDANLQEADDNEYMRSAEATTPFQFPQLVQLISSSIQYPSSFALSYAALASGISQIDPSIPSVSPD